MLKQVQHDNYIPTGADNITNVKLPSFLYIDDRCICFKGKYAETLEEIKNFKVYWK